LSSSGDRRVRSGCAQRGCGCGCGLRTAAVIEFVRIHPTIFPGVGILTIATTGGSGTATFNSRWIPKPVNDTLAAHGSKPRRTAIGKLFRRLLSMPS
jgi:hypothetical protein